MLSKSELKKKFILKRAKQVFIKKGYKTVTMTDIIEECEISRGGLYLYYKSPSEIFLKILEAEREETGDVFLNAMRKGVPATKILKDFLKDQKREIFNKEESLKVAIFEFFTIYKDDFKEDIMRQQFESAVKIVSGLIRYGINKGEFKTVDKKVIARNIIFLIEGIRISSEVMDIKEDLIDEQFNCIKDMLLSEENMK